jgi:hypothetical protein
LTASSEDVVEALLFISIMFAIMSFSLLIEHVDNRFEIAMGSLVYLHLTRALDFQNLKTMKKCLLCFSDCLDPLLE